MTKDEIIASLLNQLKDTNNQVTALTGRVNELLAKVAELTAIIKALQEEKGAKEKTLRKANNTIKGLGKLLEKEKSNRWRSRSLQMRKRKSLTRPGASAGRPVATTAPRETSMRSARWNTRMFIHHVTEDSLLLAVWE